MNNENYNVEEEEGVSLSEIFGWIKRRWLILVGLTVAITLFVGVFFQFLIIPGKTTYNMKFSYEYVPHLEDGYHLDGTKFQYRDLISIENLTTVKEGEAKFKELDITGIFEDKNLEITEKRVYVDEKNPTSELLGIEYEIVVPAKYFEDKTQAKEFLIDLVNVPVERNLSYLTQLNMFDFETLEEANTYEEQLSILNNYIDSIRNGYTKLIETYGNHYVYFNDSSYIDSNFTFKSDLLDNILREFEFKLSKTNYTYFKNEYNTYHYIKDYKSVQDKITNYISMLDFQIQNKTITLDTLKSQLDDLKSGNSGNDFGQSITSLVDKISDLNIEISNLSLQKTRYENIKKSYEQTPGYEGKDYLNDTKVFDEGIKNVINVVREQASKFEYVYKNLNTRDSEVVYMYNSVVKYESTSIIIVLGVGLVLGLVVGATVAGITGYNDTKREAKKEELIK